MNLKGRNMSSNRTAIVTGGSGGIGSEICKRLPVMASLVGAFLNLRESARRLSDGGRLIFVSSQLAERPRMGTGAYSVTKAGIDAMIVSMSHELETSGFCSYKLRSH